MVPEDLFLLGEVDDSEVPLGWAVTALTDVATIGSGQVDPTADPYRSWPLIAPNHIQSETAQLLGGIETAAEQGAISGKYKVRSGDVVYSKIRPYLRKAWLADRAVLCSADMYPLRVTGRVDAEYLLAVLLSGTFSRYAERMSARTGIPKINREGLSRYQFPLPPLPEQKKIAEILSSVDEAIAATRRVIEQTERVKKGLLQTLMTRGIGHTRFKQTEIGEIPEGWEVVKIDELGGIDRPAVKAGPFGSALRKADYVASGYKVYGQEQVIGGSVEIGDYWISENKYRELESCAVQAGDVLVSLVGTPGRTLVLTEGDPPGVINPRLVRISPDKTRVHPKYLKLVFETGFVKRSLARASQGGTMPVLNAGIISDVTFPLPPIAEQERLVDRFNLVDGHLKHSLEVETQLQHLKRGLLQDLLTGRVRVPVD